ncbi:MAG: hypothetical protein SFX73_36045 [Kofleriaceae bacterium]|nr:hypothetical protein [Kofleriaceae bacterium]
MGSVGGRNGSSVGYWDWPAAFVGVEGTCCGSFATLAPVAISADASTIAMVRSENGVHTGFRWSEVEGLVALTGSESSEVPVVGISGDGVTVLGSAAGRAAYWTLDAPTVPVPAGFPQGVAGSLLAKRDDGRFLGRAADGAPAQVPALFYLASETLSPAPLPDVGLVLPTRATPDGHVVVGTYWSYEGPELPFVWSDRFVSSFVTLSEIYAGARPIDASADGSVVVGEYWNTAPGYSGWTAFVWDPISGFRSLRDVLTAAGVDTSEVALRTATAVSADGRIVVGDSFIARIPEPAPEPAAIASGVAALLALVLRRCRAAQCAAVLASAARRS